MHYTYDMNSYNAESLSILWDSLTPKLFGYLINTLRDRGLAEDILQTTWIKVAQALPGFKEKGAGINAWIFMIARNECRDHWRKAGRETPFDPVLHDREAGGEQELENKMMAEQILAALQPEDREILRLRFIADLSSNDIAKALNINFVSARVRLHRALARARAVANT